MKRSIRELQIPDELWGPLGELAERTGSDPDALVRQALHAFLRFHGALAEETAPAAGGARAARTRRVLDTASELERAIPASRKLPMLRLVGEAGPLATVTGERFLVGRGRHCDLVIDSAKVSREHAAIQREPDGWWIEDLGSSNGTWFQRARVGRRRIEHGDEYLICAEKIRCLLS
jgi:predicted transcriptional regulator